MDGIHDMGGMHGFGKVEPEHDEPVFHASWEGRCLALNRAMAAIGVWTIDESRASIESLPPDVYLSSSYHRKWALGLEKRYSQLWLGRRRRESGRGSCATPGAPSARKLTAADLPRTLTRGSYYRAPQAPARFKPGDRVRTKNIHPETYTRLPRYARDRIGVIEANRGCHVFPDTVAHRAGEIRNGSTRCYSRGENCGAKPAIRR